MALKWKPYVADASGHRRTLQALFHAGIAQRLDPRKLCEIGAGIARFSSYDAQQVLALSSALIEHAPEDASVWYFRSQALRLGQSEEEAMQACDRALTLEPDHPEALMMKGKLLLQNDQLEAAERLLVRLDAKAPGLAATAFCECLLRQRKLGEAAALIERSTKGLAGPTGMLAMDCVRSVLDGDIDRLAALHDRDLIGISSIAGESAISLNRELVAVLRSNSALVDDPASTTTVNGRQAFLNDLLPAPLLSEILSVIKSRVEAYFAQRAGHPYLGNLPSELSLTSWAVSLDQRGFQDSHCHPDGRLSGVYYVDVARETGSKDSAGDIEFWQAPKELVGEIEAETMSVRPENGLTVIFPSYFYHRTIPHEGRDGRISIAFDIG